MIGTDSWRSICQRMHEKTMKHNGGSIVLWRCVSHHGVRNLVVINDVMNKPKFLKKIQENESAIRFFSARQRSKSINLK